MLGPRLSGTKWDRDKPIFLQKEGVNQIVLRYKMGPHQIENPQNGAHHR